MVCLSLELKCGGRAATASVVAYGRFEAADFATLGNRAAAVTRRTPNSGDRAIAPVLKRLKHFPRIGEAGLKQRPAIGAVHDEPDQQRSSRATQPIRLDVDLPAERL